MEISINQIINAIKTGYPVYIIINGETYTLKTDNKGA